MGRGFNTNTDNHDEWLTPKYITDALGSFDTDPCSPGDRRPWDTAENHYSLPDDGLTMPWYGRVWCNPPYGKETFKWLERMADHAFGTALIFARTETKGFHATIWQRAHSVFFFEGRLKFCRVTGETGDTANAPSCLVAYSEYDTVKIRNSGLKGKLVILNQSKEHL